MHLSTLPGKASDAAPSGSRSLVLFFVLVVVLTIPFWLLGAATGLDLLPGLPIAALAAFCPMIAAMIVLYREQGMTGVIGLLKRAFDFRRIKAPIWYIVVLLLMPLVMVLSYIVLRLIGTPIPAPQINPLNILILCALFFIAALGEELGWAGYATDPMQARWGALRASLLLGAIWALIHYIGLAQAHRPLNWIAWWTLGAVAARVIITWLYNNTGKSVFAAALFHMMINLTWQLFPVNGSYYDPAITGSITALAALIVILIWEPQTLARYRTASV